MLIFLTSLFATLNNAVLDLPFPCCPGLENLALRHHSGVLQRSARKRPKLTSGDRLLWICLSLWYARIPSGSHVTEMLALICSAYVTWKTREASSAGRKYPQPD